MGRFGVGRCMTENYVEPDAPVKEPSCEDRYFGVETSPSSMIFRAVSWLSAPGVTVLGL